MANFHVPNPYRASPLLNSDPYTNLYLKQQAQKQAKEVAFDSYIDKLGKDATPAGMRSVDIPSFTEKAAQWRQFGIENKKPIQHPELDGGKARTQFMRDHQELLGIAASSKGELASSKEWSPIFKDPAKARLITPAMMEEMSLSDLPVTDPRYKPFDHTKIGFDAPDLTIKDHNDLQKRWLSKLPPKTLVRTELDPSNPYGTVDVYERKFEKGGLQAIGEDGFSMYENNPSFRKSIIKLYDEIGPRENKFNPNEIEIPEDGKLLNNTFKKVYGRDMHGEEDFARAYALQVADQDSTERKPGKPNTGALLDRKFNDAVKLKAIDQRNRVNLAALRRKWKLKDKEGDDDAGTFTDDYIESLKSKVVSPYREREPDGSASNEGKLLTKSPLEDKAFTKKVRDKVYSVDNIALLPDGNFRRVFFKRDANNKIKKSEDGSPLLDKDLSDIITPEQVKANLASDLFTGKQLIKELKSKKPSMKKATKKASDYGLN